MVCALQYGIFCLALLLFYIFIASLHCWATKLLESTASMVAKWYYSHDVLQWLSLTLKKLNPELEIFGSVSIIKTIV